MATSITAFIGWAAEGPTTKATLVQSWSDFENQFGGLDSRSLLGYSVNQFFGNGGQQAYIVRLVGAGALPGTVGVPAGGGGTAFTVNAYDQGQWSSKYGVRIITNPSDATRFTLVVVYQPTAPAPETVVESFTNLSMLANDPQARSVESVINDPRCGSFSSPASRPPGVQPAPNTLTPQGCRPRLTCWWAPSDDADPGTPAFYRSPRRRRLAAARHHARFSTSRACRPRPIDDVRTGLPDQRAFYVVDSKNDTLLSTDRRRITGPAPSIRRSTLGNALDRFGKGASACPAVRLSPNLCHTDATRGVWKSPGIDAGLSGSGPTTV